MTDPTGFWTPQCVEASLRAVPPSAVMGCTCRWDENGNPPDDCDCAVVSRQRAVVRRGDALNAALAAKDREEMIEAAAHAIPVGAMLYRRRVASAVLAALGLLASPDEKDR